MSTVEDMALLFETSDFTYSDDHDKYDFDMVVWDDALDEEDGYETFLVMEYHYVRKLSDQ